MNLIHEFFVPGTPVGQPRARHAKGRTYAPDGPITLWRNRIEFVAIKNRPEKPIDGPIVVNLLFSFPRPKSHYKKTKLRDEAPLYHIIKPDRDNLDKAVLDVLKNVKFFAVDDCQVCAGEITKIYGDEAGCLVSIRPL